jgi:type II secretory pathway component PulJ
VLGREGDVPVTKSLLQRLRTARASACGFTVVEVTVASSLLLLVLGAVFSVLVSLTSAENRSQALVNNQELVRLRLLEIDRNLRSASTLNAVSDATQYPYEVDFTALDGSIYRWRLNSSTNAIRREKYVNGSWQQASSDLVNVTNASSSVPVFRYYRASSNLEINPATSTSADVANCAIRVHVTITSATYSGPKPFTSEYDVQLRNRLPAGIPGC